ncbi:MAG: hypothetical protein ACTSVA_06590 [Candidatus Njordarchaeales archaeon]
MKDFDETIFSLRFLEKRVENSIRKMDAEEKKLRDKLVLAILNKDEEAARDYARDILLIRKRKNLLRKYLSRIRSVRLDLESAYFAKEIEKTLISAAKALISIEKTLNEVKIIKSLEEVKRALNNIGLMVNEHDLSVSEYEVMEFLKKAESIAEETLKEELPEVVEEVSKEVLEGESESEKEQ